jgi:hypothetical protein
LPVGKIHIGDTRIPLRDLILIGNYRQINYSAPKFTGEWIEYKHRPKGFPNAARKLKSQDGGLVFLHPAGAYMLIVPGKNQRSKFRMDRRGLTN